jgi:hypothetical protein
VLQMSNREARHEHVKFSTERELGWNNLDHNSRLGLVSIPMISADIAYRNARVHTLSAA